MRRLMLVLLTAVAAPIAWVAWRNYLAVEEDFERYPASPLLQHPEQTRVSSLRETSFRLHSGVRVAGWYVPSRNRAAVIVTHGTGSDRSSMLAEIRILAEAGFGVLAFDWPGEGASEGQARWDVEDREALVAAIDWLSARPEVAPAQIGGLGFSMGGYVMALVAAKELRLRALVLLATPSDYSDLTRWQHQKWGLFSELPAEWALHRSGLGTESVRPVDVLGEIAPRPVALLRGSADEVVPEYMTQALYAAARSPKSLWIIPGAHHGGYAEVSADRYRRLLVNFFSDSLQGGAAGTETAVMVTHGVGVKRPD